MRPLRTQCCRLIPHAFRALQFRDSHNAGERAGERTEGSGRGKRTPAIPLLCPGRARGQCSGTRCPSHSSAAVSSHRYVSAHGPWLAQSVGSGVHCPGRNAAGEWVWWGGWAGPARSGHPGGAWKEHWTGSQKVPGQPSSAPSKTRMRATCLPCCLFRDRDDTRTPSPVRPCVHEGSVRVPLGGKCRS